MSYVGKPIGLKNLTIFPLTKDDSTGATYGAAKNLARAIKVQMSPQFAEAILESDDSVEDEINMLTGYELTIDASQLDDTIRAELLGHTLDAKGGLVVAQNDTPPRFALAFKALLSKQAGVNKYVHIVLYKGSFSEFEESFETMKKGAMTFQTHSGIKGVFSARDSDGQILYRMREDTPSADAATIGAWFTKVQPQTAE